MSKDHLDFPHVYKKNKVLKLKPLDLSKNPRSYYFSSQNGSIQAIINHCNNINQITARNWLKLSKVLSYFGLEKDTSDSISKNKSPFNRFLKDISHIFREGEGSTKKASELGEILEKIKNLDLKIENLNKRIPDNLVTKALIKELVKDFDERLTEVRDDIKKVIG
ncbi:unnamed protein product [Figwort mosaic virus]|uniref:Aphid transmission protein n=1 Tax=Figwort mosaic virus (strain DxS) TaxID=10650 RepID=VAT_FMVD|nr:unnamed protein product [Figwort mosaic virus]P09521.1 RecName: Full=Aphid transmission protein; AltName: Full=Atf; AltName: Full=Protein 2 [Figwort mosaic virus (STRAIN DXS)]CAA29524.1 unnamed protein product [Figwort mosaic virus]